MKVPKNPSQNYIVGALMICFAAAWLTDFIGVHPIFGKCFSSVFEKLLRNFGEEIVVELRKYLSFTLFFKGAFIAGAIMPRKNGFSVKIIEKIEDINSFILLPLVRTSSNFFFCRSLFFGIIVGPFLSEIVFP